MAVCVRWRRFSRLRDLCLGAAAVVMAGAWTTTPAAAQQSGPVLPPSVSLSAGLALQVGGLFGASESSTDRIPVVQNELVPDLAPASFDEPPVPSQVDLLAQLKQYAPPPGQWAQVPNTEFDRFRLSDAVAQSLGILGSAGSRAVLTNLTGAAFDPEAHAWYFWGGGDLSYGGNEVYRLDLESGALTQITDPSVLDRTIQGNGGVDCQVPSDGPSASSTYDGIVWSPETQTFFVFPTSRFCPNTTASAESVWEFDPTLQSWSAVASLGDISGPVFTAYDPNSKTILVVTTGTPARIRRFDPVSGNFSPPSDLGQGLNSSGTMVLPAGSNDMLLVSQEGVFAVSTTNLGTMTRLADVPPEVNAHAGVAYHPDSGLLVAWNGDKTVYSFDPDTATWTTHDATTGPTTPNQHVFSKWIYIDEAGVFAGYQNPDEGLWLYRLPTSAGGTTPTNDAPIADAGSNKTVSVGTQVTLNGTASADPDGDSLSYAWEILTRPSGSTAGLNGAAASQASLTPDVAGTYTVRLTVSDGTLSDSDTMTVTAVNNPPVANAGSDRTVTVGQSVTLNGGGSFDSNGDPLTYQWTLISQPAGSTAGLTNATSKTPTLMLDVAGAFVIQLIVHDGVQASAADTVRIT
ncbi:MAG: hypothetical protein D6826_03545, partial [Alphaproteobacteria bacterium]